MVYRSNQLLQVNLISCNLAIIVYQFRKPFLSVLDFVSFFIFTALAWTCSGMLTSSNDSRRPCLVLAHSEKTLSFSLNVMFGVEFFQLFLKRFYVDVNTCFAFVDVDMTQGIQCSIKPRSFNACVQRNSVLMLNKQLSEKNTQLQYKFY